MGWYLFIRDWSWRAEASLDPAAPLAQQAALLAGMDVFWVLMWVGLGGAALLLRQRAFD